MAGRSGSAVRGRWPLNLPEVVTTSEIPLAESAQTWGLSEAEFRRYQRLMAGRRGNGRRVSIPSRRLG